MAIRSSAKAILVHKGKILLIHGKKDKGELYYDLPGGGQNPYESMEEAVEREVLEETGYQIKNLRFAGIAEMMIDSPDIREKYPDYAHRIHHIFLAELEDETIHAATETDSGQIGMEWMTLEEADSANLCNLQLRGRLGEAVTNPAPRYYGCCHVAD